MSSRLIAHIALTGCFVLAGCSSLQSNMVKNQLQASSERFIGRHHQSLVDHYGQPDYKKTLDTGEELWTYEREWVPPGDEGYAFQGEEIISERALNAATSAWRGIITYTIAIDGTVADTTVKVR